MSCVWNFETLGWLAVLLNVSTTALLFLCAQADGRSRRKRLSRRDRRHDGDDVSDNEATARDVEQSSVAPLKSQRSLTSQRSVRNQKRDPMDSIKIVRGKKVARKARQLKEKQEGSDSQHTETITVPLGKAAKCPPPPSKLTSPSELKELELAGSGDEKKVKFAEKLVKSTLSPSSEAEPEKSRKAAKSAQRKSLRSGFRSKKDKKSTRQKK